MAGADSACQGVLSSRKWAHSSAEAAPAPPLISHPEAQATACMALPQMTADVLRVADQCGEVAPKPSRVLFLPQVQLGNQSCSKGVADNPSRRLLVNKY